MKKWFLPVLLFISASLSAGSDEYRIAFLDFDIMTTKEDFRYVGKGLSEMVAFELQDENKIQVIERGKRNAAFDEMNFSLTGLSDESAALDLGRLLTANYLVIGEIIEMDNQFLVNMKLMEVESGAIVWQDQLLTRLKNASTVSRFFAESLVSGIVGKESAEDRSSAEQVVLEEESGDDLSGSLIAFSTAVDAIDEGDEDKAREELGRARSIDPGNDAIRYFLDLLSVVAPKYKYELRAFGNVYNPAYLPRNSSDKFYLWESVPMAILQEKVMYEVSPDISTYEGDPVISGGYLFPVGDRHGFDFQFSWSYLVRQTTTTVSYVYGMESNTYGQFSSQNWSLSIGYGYEFSDAFSMGVAFQPMFVEWPGYGLSIISHDEAYSFQFSLALGSLLTFFDGRMLWDMQLTYSYYPQYYAIEDDQAYYKGWTPLLMETSVIGAVIPRTLFLSFKGNFDIFLDDRGGLFTRLIPVVEYWPVRFLALRAGYQLSVLAQLGTVVVGHGVTGGFSLKFGKWDFDAAYSYSMNPSTNVAGYLTPLSKLHFGLTRSGNFIGK